MMSSYWCKPSKSDWHSSIPVSPVLQEADEPSQRVSYVVLYRRSVVREFCFWTLALGTGGLFCLLMYWFPLWYLRFRYVKTRHLSKACRVMVITADHNAELAHAEQLTVPRKELQLAISTKRVSSIKPPTMVPLDSADRVHAVGVANDDDTGSLKTLAFEYLCLRFVYCPWTEAFEALCFDTALSPRDLRDTYSSGITSKALLAERRKLYGPGCMEVPVPPLYKLVITEIFHPFYVFQMAAISVWLWDEYYQYAGAIIAITLISLVTEIFEARRNQLKLQRMAKLVRPISVCREGNVLVEKSSSLVPGDIVEVGPGVLPCDLILLKGSVLVNESMLTGESVPVIKTPLEATTDEETVFDIKRQDLTCILYGGTDVVQLKTTFTPIALVARTGFSTAQGRMMRAILHPVTHRRSDFRRETYKFLAVLVLLACIGAALSLVMTLSHGLQFDVVLIRFLDTFTNAVPPALPATMTVGATFAVGRYVVGGNGTAASSASCRLRRLWKVVCIAPSRINIAGQVNTLVLDKTGTMTEDGLDIEGVLHVAHRPDGRLFLSALKRQSADLWSAADVFVEAIATCHGVSLLEDNLVGDPMDVQLLKFSQWTFKEASETGECSRSNGGRLPCLAEVYPGHGQKGGCRILKRFDFVPALQRMSVISQRSTVGTSSTDDDQCVFRLHCKGSPEQLHRLCLPETIPTDFQDRLQRYTEAGMRVLAFGSKVLSHGASASHDTLIHCSREEAEAGLTFLGFVVFANTLKTDTRSTIECLREAGCRCLMATGDNPLTAAAVAREASLINRHATTILVGDMKLQGTAGSNGCSEDSKTTTLMWTPIMYAATMSSLCLSDEATDSWSSQDDGDVNVRDVTMTIADAASPRSDWDGGYHYTTDEMIHYVSGKDPRDVVTVLTGPALRYLHSLQTTSSTSVTSVFPSQDGTTSQTMPHVYITVDSVDGAPGHRHSIHAIHDTEVSVKKRDSVPECPEHVDGATKPSVSSHVLRMSLLEYCLRFCRIYARMTPADKALLVLALRQLPAGPLVGMCGDGANDCEALKAADIGISLSNKEASIAAPFTSTRKTIKSCADVLREGRGALVNSFQSFKYVALYALVQLVTTSALYYYGGNLTDPQYLWVDLVLALPLSMTMAWTHSATELTDTLPIRRLVGLPVILSLIGQIMIQVIFLFIAIGVLSAMPFYVRFQPDTETSRFGSEELKGQENTTIFLLSNFQYLVLNLVLTCGRPWRKRRITNPFYSASVIGLMTLSVLLLVSHEVFPALAEWLALERFPGHFRVILALIILCNSVATFAFEHFVVGWAIRREMRKDMLSHYIDYILPLNKRQRVRFRAPVF